MACVYELQDYKSQIELLTRKHIGARQSYELHAQDHHSFHTLSTVSLSTKKDKLSASLLSLKFGLND